MCSFLASHNTLLGGLLFFVGILILLLVGLIFIGELLENWKYGQRAAECDRAFRNAIEKSDAIVRDAEQRIRQL